MDDALGTVLAKLDDPDNNPNTFDSIRNNTPIAKHERQVVGDIRPFVYLIGRLSDVVYRVVQLVGAVAIVEE